MIVLDEAVSALDVTMQAQILDLLVALQAASGVSYLFISHDLGVISHLSDRVLVMKDGVVVEDGRRRTRSSADPQHPYTRELIASIPEFDPAAAIAEHESDQPWPSPSNCSSTCSRWRCVSHITHGLWPLPGNNRHRFADLDYWLELAQILEHGGFDGVFLADVIGAYDVFRGGPETALREGLQSPNIDPLLVIPAMAAVTERLGFGVTFSTTYEPPFAFARRMSTLDHLTKGRVGWNVVTSYLPNAAHNFGLDGEVPHDLRYQYADEYLDVLYKLWEGSWDDGAVVADRENEIYTDPVEGALHQPRRRPSQGRGAAHRASVAAAHAGHLPGHRVAGGHRVRRPARRGRVHRRPHLRGVPPQRRDHARRRRAARRATPTTSSSSPWRASSSGAPRRRPRTSGGSTSSTPAWTASWPTAACRST